MSYRIYQPVSQYPQVQVSHGGVIIFVVDRPQVQIGFQGSERIFYLSDCVINIPDYILFLYIQVGAEKIDAEAFIFFQMLICILFPGDFCCQTCFWLTAYSNVIIVLDRGVFLFGPAYTLMDFIGFFLRLPCCAVLYVSFAAPVQTFFQIGASCLPPSFPWRDFLPQDNNRCFFPW